MAYYAPFYRPAYYDPMQQLPNSSQFGQQFPQQMPQPVQAQPTNDFLWVLNENEATSYPVAPNNTVTLWDKNLPTIYIKSVNAQGVPSMRVLDFTERTSNVPVQSSSRFSEPQNVFATVEEVNALRDDVRTLRTKLDEIKTNNTAKNKNPEVESNG